MRLLAFHHGFGVSSSFFSSSFGVGSSFFSGSFGLGSSCFGVCFHFFASGGCVVGDGFSVCSHCFINVRGFVGGFGTSSKAQGRGGDCSSKNDLTHNVFLHSAIG